MTTRARLNGILKATPWIPQPGAQTEAFLSKADILLFGGAAGSGKTDLCVGTSLTSHIRTLFIRREGVQLNPVIDRVAELLGSRDGLNMTTRQWQLGENRVLTFGGVPNPDDVQKYQGQSRDLLVLDEAANLLEEQVRFLLGWVRSTRKDQRCRVIMASNPPTSSEGRWIVDYFAPWLNPEYPDPAEPGELRWFASLDGKDQEVPNKEKFQHNGEWIIPQSRTFIPGRVQDNKYLRDTGYISTLQALPEPLRSQMLHGDFQAGAVDSDYQLIPTEWIRAAMDRWEPRKDKGTLNCIGCDPARGGADSSVIAKRYDGWWFDELSVHELTPSGGDVAALVINELGQDFSIPVNLDIIGIGSSVYDHLRSFNVNVTGLNGAAKSENMDITGNIGYGNLRAELYWELRQLLSPETSVTISLPPDQKLLADLASPMYKMTPRGVMVESKLEIVKRLGRSPDRGDAVAYAAHRTIGSHNVRPVRVIHSVGRWNAY